VALVTLVVKYGGADLSPNERSYVRASQPEKSATFVVYDGQCLGIRAGAATFRELISVDIAMPPQPEIFCVRYYATADLLSLCVLIGNPGQAPHSCCYCRCSAADFKLTADDPAHPGFELRTRESQAADLRAFQAQIQWNTKPVNGVSRPLLTSVHFLRVVMPTLHVVVLGPVNEVVARVSQELLELDGADPAAAETIKKLVEDKEDSEAQLALGLNSARELLGSKDPAVLVCFGSTADSGLLIGTVPLSCWDPLVEALNAAAVLKEEDAKGAELPPNRGWSARKKAQAKATKNRALEQAAELKGAALNLGGFLDATKAARAAIEMHESEMPGGNEEEGQKGGGSLSFIGS